MGGTKCPFRGAGNCATSHDATLRVVTGRVGLFLSCPDHRPVGACRARAAEPHIVTVPRPL